MTDDVTEKVQAQFQEDAVNIEKICMIENLDPVTSRVLNNIWLTIDGNTNLASNEMDILHLLQMRIRPIKTCVHDIYIDVLQALKSEEQSGWDQDIQIEYLADCEVGFVETLIHYLSELPIIGKHNETGSLKDQKAMLAQPPESQSH